MIVIIARVIMLIIGISMRLLVVMTTMAALCVVLSLSLSLWAALVSYNPVAKE